MSYNKIFDPMREYHNKYFSPDYVKNNPVLLYIISVDGKFEPLNVYTLVRGSVKLKQTLCGESFFLWGGCNASMLQFECCSSALIQNAPDGKIQLRITPTVYEDGKLKEKLESESINLFTGYIEQAESTRIPGNWRVTAYDRFYRMRNVSAAPFIQAYINQALAAGNKPTWYDIMALLHLQMGFTDGATVDYPKEDTLKSVLFPTNREIIGENGIDLLREFALMTQTFGMIDGDGKLQYKAVDDVTGEGYFCFNTWDPQSLSYSDGHIWTPCLFTSEPKTNLFYVQPETTPEEDYYNNVYTIKNSPLLGDDEWIRQMYECDEYGAPSPKYSASNMPAGLFDTDSLCVKDRTYHQQAYSLKTYADPTIPLGSLILINKFENDSGYKNIVLSYIMSRTITFESSQTILCDMSAENGPYNSVVPEYEYGVQTANRIASETSKKLPFIVDAGKMTQLRAQRVLSRNEYNALEEKRADTIYYVYDDEGGDS